MKTVLYTDVLYRAAELAGRPRDKLPVSEATMLQSSIAVDLEDVWNRVVWPELNPDPLNVTATSQKFSKNEGVNTAGPINLVNNDPVNNVTFVISGGTGATVAVNQGLTGTVGVNLGTTIAVQVAAVTVASATIPDAAIYLGSITWDGANITFQPTIPMGDVLTVLTANPKATTKYRSIGFLEGDGQVWIDDICTSVWVDFVLPAPDLMSLTGTPLNNYAIPQRFRNYLGMRGAAMLLGMDGQGAAAGAWLGAAETALAGQVMRLPPPPEWRQVRTRTGFGRRRHVSNTTVGQPC